MYGELQTPFIDSPLVELYTIDLTSLTGGIFRFTPHFSEGGSVTFGGNAYTSIPIISEGWEVTATGTQPRPTLTISNVNKVLHNAVVSLGDIVGAKLTRTRTLKKHLDGEPNADANAFLKPEVYEIEQKTLHTSEVIQWQLSSVIDKFGVRIPRRQVTRDNFPGVGRQRGLWR
jgi:lambda family phage minor tail protein L